MNRKSQEISLNLIVIGSLALLVLLIVGGILIFGGGDLLSGFTNFGSSAEETTQMSFINHCRSECNTLNLRLTWEQLEEDPALFHDSVYGYCCEHSDLDKSGGMDYYGAKGPEICSLSYDCDFDGRKSYEFCEGIYFNGVYNVAYKYLWIGPIRGAGEYFCTINPIGYVPQGEGVNLNPTP